MRRDKQFLCILGFYSVMVGLYPAMSYAIFKTIDPPLTLSGLSVTDFGINDDIAYDLAVQPDGKLIVVGTSHNSSDNDMAVARYLEDGTLDSQFNSDGRATFAVGNGNDGAYGVDIQNDGKIVLAGYTHNGLNKDFAIIRLTQDGFLDKEFDGDGQVVVSFAKGDDTAYKVKVLEDGKIVVAGVGEHAEGKKATVILLNSDGSLVKSFGEDGKSVVKGEQETAAYTMLILDNGKILIGGYSKTENDTQMALFRLQPSGFVDSSFGVAGTAIIEQKDKSSVGYGIALQPDNKIIVTGSSYNGKYRDILIARVNENGSIDSSFGIKGSVVSDLGYDSVAYSVAIRPDSSIVSVGFGSKEGNKDIVLVYYDTDGEITLTNSSVGDASTTAGQEGR